MAERIQCLEKEIATWSDDYQKKEADIFVKVYSVGAKKQEWMILSVDDLERSYGGAEVAHKIIGILNSYSDTTFAG